MIWADYVIIALIVLSILISLWRGFIKESLSLATWVLAFWLSLAFAESIAPWLGRWIDTPSVRIIVAFCSLFVVVLILGAVINHFATLAVAKTGLSGTDRLIGAFFGAARGIALVAALVLVGGLTNLARDPWWQQSRLIPYVQPVAHWMMHFLPTHLRKNVRLQ